MEMVIDMTEVTACDVEACMYNKHCLCHAKAITVGGMNDHQCDTMFYATSHTHRTEVAGVGACRVRNCINNDDCECQAECIGVTFNGDKADCTAFSQQ